MRTEERRMHDRVGFTGRVAVLATPSSPPLRLPAANLSEGGVCLMTSHPFRRGDRVGVRLSGAGGELTVPVGEVAWVLREVKGSSRAPMVGLRFINLRPNERQQLKKLVDAAAGSPESLPPLPPADAAGVPARTMHAEPSLTPLQSSLPPISSLPQSIGPEAFQSLPADGPSLAEAAPAASGWCFSAENVSRPSAPPRVGGSPTLLVAGGLLVVGTLAGMIFGVLDQRGRASPQRAPVVAATTPSTETDAAQATSAEPASEPVAAALPAPKATPVVPAARHAATRDTIPTSTVSRPLPAPMPREEKARDKTPPLPNHRPGRVVLSPAQVAGNEVIIPIRGALRVEKQFVLKAPDRVVLDIVAEGMDGAKEQAGRATVHRLRLANRAGGVRLVLDVKDARIAGKAKVARRNGLLVVVLPAS